jgi:hypothetical protein
MLTYSFLRHHSCEQAMVSRRVSPYCVVVFTQNQPPPEYPFEGGRVAASRPSLRKLLSRNLLREIIAAKTTGPRTALMGL